MPILIAEELPSKAYGSKEYGKFCQVPLLTPKFYTKKLNSIVFLILISFLALHVILSFRLCSRIS